MKWDRGVLRFVFLFTLTVGSVGAAPPPYWGDNPNTPPPIPGIGFCGVGYRYDSYGTGLQAVFLEKDLRASMGVLRDEGCYRLGEQRAREVLQYADQQWDQSRCRRDFNEGLAEGLKASPQSAGRECYGVGYIAGRALLDVSARTGRSDQVGEFCVEEFKRGYRDAKVQVAATPVVDSVPQACYQTGYNDAAFLYRRSFLD